MIARKALLFFKPVGFAGYLMFNAYKNGLSNLFLEYFEFIWASQSGWEVKVKICVPVPAKTLHETFTMIGNAEREGADLIEIRLDYMGLDILKDMSRLEDMVEQCSVPLIATNRHAEQGGECKLNEAQRLKTLIRAAEAGFTYVDVELTTQGVTEVIDAVKAYGAKAIVSFHNFDYTPSFQEMEKIAGAQVKAGADVCKIVTMAKDLADSIRCLLFTLEISENSNLVCFAMGEKGLLSRVLSPLFGASFTYASLGEGLETAPGQISVRELREIYRRLNIYP